MENGDFQLEFGKNKKRHIICTLINIGNMKTIYVTLVIASIFCSCKNGNSNNNSDVKTIDSAKVDTNFPIPDSVHFSSADLSNEIDLSKYGVPVLIMSPKNSRVIVDSVEHKIYVYANKHFIIETTIENNQKTEDYVSKLKSAAIDKSNFKDFVKLRDEVPCGFLAEYQNNILRFIVGLQGKDGNSYMFTSGTGSKFWPANVSDFSSADLETMYVSGESAELK